MVWGSDKILDELEEIGEATKPSPLILALIIMGVDLEEFIASLTGAIGGLPELAVRNVIGFEAHNFRNLRMPLIEEHELNETLEQNVKRWNEC